MITFDDVEHLYRDAWAAEVEEARPQFREAQRREQLGADAPPPKRKRRRRKAEQPLQRGATP
jgi:hypothetical protein